MLKATGVIITVAVCSFVGFRASAKLSQRHKTLSDFHLLLGEIADKMRVGINLDGILKGERAQRLCEREGYRLKPKTNGLTVSERELLEEFFFSLGMADTEAELTRCAAYRELLSAMVAAAGNEVSEKAKLYGLLGLFSGIFISILLI